MEYRIKQIADNKFIVQEKQVTAFKYKKNIFSKTINKEKHEWVDLNEHGLIVFNNMPAFVPKAAIFDNIKLALKFISDLEKYPIFINYNEFDKLSVVSSVKSDKVIKLIDDLQSRIKRLKEPSVFKAINEIEFEIGCELDNVVLKLQRLLE